jgi:hypothetical protein
MKIFQRLITKTEIFKKLIPKAEKVKLKRYTLYEVIN